MARRLGRGNWTMLGAVAVLALLLVALAALQYRWTSELAAAGEQRVRGALTRAAFAFASDFDRELLRLLLHFGELDAGDDQRELAPRTAAWRRQALYPELLRGVFHVRRKADGTLLLRRLDETSARLQPVSWPDELLPARDALARSTGGPPLPAPLVAAAPVWVVPLLPARMEERWALHHGDGMAPLELALLWIDNDALRKELLPALAERHFGDDDYRIEVRDQADALLFARGASAVGGQPDVVAPLFRMGGVERMRHRGGHFRERGELPRKRRMRDPDDGHWRLQVTHPAGSIAAAMARVRFHNLTLALAALLLLAAAVTLVLLLARRAQALARRQIELVAGISHELLTPVAAVRSAGENLAAGVVAEPAQVRAYGELIEREARRLGSLVEQVLAWAGLQVRGEPVVRQLIAPGALVGGVAAACAHEAERSGVRLETQVASDLPALQGDPTALERALRNLVENAMRHGGEGGWVALGAAPTGPVDGAAAGVALWVEDRGQGVPPEELPRLFEPFHRGARSLERGVPGSGLGLALVRQIVEAHGGRVKSAPAQPQGTRFTVELPAAG